MIRAARLTILAAFAAGLLAGCRPSVEDVCEDLSDQCSETTFSECLFEGESLEQQAHSIGCDEQFDAYIDCASDAVCAWEPLCETQRIDLLECGAVF